MIDGARVETLAPDKEGIMTSKTRMILAWMVVALLLLACQPGQPTDKGHTETIKLARDFYTAVFAKDYFSTIKLTCLGQQNAQIYIGAPEINAIQKAFPWQDLKLTQVTELDYNEGVSHLQLTFQVNNSSRDEGITLKKINGAWCVDFFPVR